MKSRQRAWCALFNPVGAYLLSRPREGGDRGAGESGRVARRSDGSVRYFRECTQAVGFESGTLRTRGP